MSKSELKELVEIGGKYLFHGRMIYLGEVVEITLFDIAIKNASWMQDMGRRMGELLEEGINGEAEIEVAPKDNIVVIPRGSFAKFPWNHKLPDKSQ